MEYQGDRGNDQWLPHLFGHEAVGSVVDFGRSVSGFNAGDEVILTWLSPPSVDFMAPNLRDSSGKIVNSGRVATFGEFAIVDQACCIKKPRNIKDEVAVLFGCALGTGAGMAINATRDRIKTEKICVLGLGGIGISATLALVARGFTRITVMDVSQQKVAWVVKNLNINAEMATPKLIQSFQDQFDLCLEATGTTSGIEAGFSMVRKRGGELIFASHPPDDEYISLKPHDLISGKQISGSWGGGTNPESDFAKLADLFSDSQELLVKSTGPYYRLGQIQEALMELKQGRAFRPIIDMRKN